MPKPPSLKTHKHRVRVDLEHDQAQRLVDHCQRISSRYILVSHVLPTGNPHFHFYVENNLSQGNYRNRIKEEFSVEKADLCVESVDDEKLLSYYSYLFNTKNGNIPHLVQYAGFSPIDIATYKENAKLVTQEYQSRMAAGKKTQIDIVQLVLAKLGDHTSTVEYVYDLVIETLKYHRMMARPYHIRDIIATVQAYSNDRQSRVSIKAITLKFFSSN